MIEHTYDDKKGMAIEHTHMMIERMMIEQPTNMIEHTHTHDDRTAHDDR